VVGDNGVLLHLLLPPRGLRLRLIEDQSGMAAVSYGFALRPDDSELQAKLDHGLAALKADGSYQSLYARYFGSGR
jgi:polar amino acid transport system substrate-binding protein